MKAENQLQLQISKYMQSQYPKTIFRFDLAAGTKMSMPMAMRNKSMNPHKGFPDFFLLKKNSNYGGLFIELKAKSIYKKDGSLLKSEHLESQQRMHETLTNSGYYAVFGIGFEECKRIIDWYMYIV